MTGLVATEVPVAMVIPVATAFCVAFLSRPVNGSRQCSTFWSSDRRLPPVRVAGVAGGPARLSRRPVRACSSCGLGGCRVMFVTRCPASSRLEGRRLKALAASPFPLLALFPSLLLSEEEKAPLSSPSSVWCSVAAGGSCGAWRGVVEARRWRVSAGAPGQGCPLDLLVGNATALADNLSGGCFRKGCRACLYLLGLLLPLPGTPIPGRLCERELLRATGVLECGLEWRTQSGGENDQLVLLTASLCVGSGATEVVGRSQRLTPNCCFSNPFLGVVCGGTGVCSSLTSWSVRGAGWFYLWALNLVEVRGGRACGETSFSLGCLVSLGVTPGCSFPTSWRSGMLVLRRETLVSRGRFGIP
ncbi:hypothetical protein Taro_039956 [Colocasia esculenta]|uniref:Uncharacterized protein n=1 Tax=Colocasia esculenta TaxID=4460 RepID=A0A843WBW8_COLES|nr:hypothetical protein [Colocasia esculenta]